MIDKNKIHEVLHSLWDNNGNTEYNRALQDAQTAFDLMQEEPEQNPVILYGLSGSVGEQEGRAAACRGCNNVKGCITCVDGSEYAHIEECDITGIKSKEATGKLKELVDNVSEEGLEEARKQLQELVNGGLDEEINRYIEQHSSELPGYFDLRRIARHFFVFGLNKSMQKESSTSVWHDANDIPVASKTKVVLYTNGKWDMFKAYETKDDYDNYWAGVNQALEEKGVLVKRWAYVEDLSKL